MMALWLSIVLFILGITKIESQTNLTSYRRLPPMFTLENYDECLVRSKSPSSYCLLFSEIEADSSELWYEIEEYSKDVLYRYRHDYIFMGLCVDKCMERLRNSPYIRENKVKSSDGNFTYYDEVVQYYQKIYRDDSMEDAVKYKDILDKCANFIFQSKYNLTLNTFVEYCSTPEKKSSIGYLEAFVYSLFSLLVILTVTSSIYDYYLKCRKSLTNQQHVDNYYTKDFDTMGSTLLTSFSIARNYKKLTSSEIGNKDFQFTYFYRAFTMFFVIWAHVIMFLMSVPMQNPQFFEDHLKQSVMIIFQNGPILIQIFFVLTGFFLKLRFDQQNPINPETKPTRCVLLYIQVFVHRYLKFLPSLVFLILFDATLLTKAGNGPLWKHMTDGEHVFCNRNWWRNILMINNYSVNDSCIQQTWYLAADMQLLALYLMIIIITAKYKKSKKYLYTLMALCSLIIPGVITYYFKLDAFSRVHPEYYRYYYFQNTETLNKIYFPTYGNLGGYFVGIICAEIYAKSPTFQELKKQCEKYKNVLKIQVLYLVAMHIVGFGTLSSGLLFYFQKPEEGSIWPALYSSVYRNFWVIFCGITIITMALKFGWLAYDITNMSAFRVLGRLTFQMYMWHVNIIRLMFGYIRQPIYITEFYVVGQVVLSYVLSAIVALIVALFVEYPITNIINSIFKRVVKGGRRKEEAGEMKIKISGT
ncbi:nose resistant to fluoxetine protein 6-like [Musca autumnalis]|uniref:nose resistant to fluoxetine protein 6-like n=1 Tax=Musca autumnalis TaxID=221902 RepID=UPI003CF8A599